MTNAIKNTRENEAINVYLKLLQAKGASGAVLHKHILFLEKLALHLIDKRLEGSEYREAIETLIESIPAEDWHMSLTAAREFYPFWVQDIKAIAALNSSSGFDIQPDAWKPESTSLKSLTDSLETEKFNVSENWPLKAYAQAMRHEGAEQSLVDTRVKLAKIILMRLRTTPLKNHKTYRTAVDFTLPLFNIKPN